MPVGIYFRKFLNEVTEGAQSDDQNEIDSAFISNLMKDFNLQQIQLRVRKIWLNELFEFCDTQLAETSREVMGDLIKFEADCQTLQIIANSLVIGGGMTNTVDRELNRRKYISKIGYLYPERDEKLRSVNDLRMLVQAVEATPYEKIL